MNAGDLDKYLEIQRDYGTTGALNQPVPDWQFLSNAWAMEVTPSAKEVSQGKDVQVDNTTFMMWLTDIKNEDRIILNSETYNVITVVEKDHYLIVKTVSVK